jgi:hypothetical protein
MTVGTLQLEPRGLETNERPTATNLAWFRGARLPIRHKVIAFDSVYYPALEFIPWGGGKWTRGGVSPGELRFQRRKDRKSVGNSGASAPMASHIRVFDTLPPKHCNWYPHGEDHPVAFLVNGFSDKRGRPFADPGAFHWRTLNQAAQIESPDKAEVAEHDTTLSDFARQKRDSMRRNSLLPEAPSPRDLWAGDDDTPDFIEGTGHVFKRGRDRDITDEEQEQEDKEWEADRAKYEAIVEAGRAWSPRDPRKDDRVLPSGVKYNLSNPTFKRIEYEIDEHWKNFDSRKKLAEELGINYETARKKELEDINMKKECPNTPFTAAQIADINANDGRVVYVHAVTDKPRWYRLDMDRFETYLEAIEEVKRRGKDKALKQSDMWNNPRAPKAKFNQALREVVSRWEEYFWKENIYVLDMRSPMVVAIAEEAWEENLV